MRATYRATMTSLGQVTRRRRGLAFALIALALAARLLLPAGFMPMNDGHGVTMTLCSGNGPLAMPGMAGRGAKHDVGGKPAPCGFGALGLAAIGGTDAPLLAAALAFVVALGLAARSAAPVPARERLRPPLRAPPA